MNFSNSTSYGTGEKDDINNFGSGGSQDQRIKDL